MPRSAKFAYDYRKGRTWKYETLYAQFDFPIYKTEDQLLAERGESSPEAIPYYKYSDEIVSRNLHAAERLELGSLRSAARVVDARDLPEGRDGRRSRAAASGRLRGRRDLCPARQSARSSIRRPRCTA